MRNIWTIPRITIFLVPRGIFLVGYFMVSEKRCPGKGGKKMKKKKGTEDARKLPHRRISFYEETLSIRFVHTHLRQN